MTVLNYYDIFQDEQPLPLDVYLTGVSKAQLQKITSYFLGIDFRTSHLNNWRELLQMWFRGENHEFAKVIWGRCEQLEKEIGTITFLREAAFLKFFEFTRIFIDGEEQIDDITSERNLFIAYLLFVSQTTDKERLSVEYIENLPEKERFAALLLNQQFAYGEYSNVQLADVFKAQLVKAAYLFLFLENNQRANYLLIAFCAFYNLKNWREFFRFVVPIIQAHSIHPKGGGWTHLDVTKDENFQKNCFFLESLSQEVDIESDFRSTRTNPLYKVDTGIFGIVYPLFVVEKIFKGSYFKLKELNDSIPDLGETIKKISDWRGFYTGHFSESILLYHVLEHIYGKRSYLQFSGDALKNIDKNGPPDYYIRNGNVIFLFENKDVHINGEIRQSYDFEKLEQALKSKLYFDTEIRNNGTLKERARAVKQLINNVMKILLKQNQYDTNYKEHNIKIYPIIVLHDTSFECPGLNCLLNCWFDQELVKLNVDGITTKNVKQITIVNIDTLIIYADFLKEKMQKLNILIDEYIKHSTFMQKNKPQTREEIIEAFSGTFEPFSVFIDKFTNTGHLKIKSQLADAMFKTIVNA